VRLVIADGLLRKESLLPIGLAIVGIGALALTSETHLALGLLAFLVLISSFIRLARIAFLILLLPFAHAGLGLDPLRGFGIYDIYAGLFILIFVLQFVSRGVFASRGIPVFGYTGIMLICFVPSLMNSIDLTVSALALVQFIAVALTAAGVCYYLMQE